MLIPILFASIISYSASTTQVISRDEQTIAIIDQASAHFGLPAEALEDLAACESSLNVKAYNPKDSDGLPAIGLFQFKNGTFDAYYPKVLGQVPMLQTNPDLFNPYQQAYTAAYMIANGQLKQWGNKCRTAYQNAVSSQS